MSLGLDADLDTAFAAEFAETLADDVAAMSAVPAGSLAHRPANSAQQSWAPPRPVRLADPVDERSAYGTASMGGGQRAALGLQADLAEALRGLSSPANPRQSILVETQSFAPERVVDERVEDQSGPELDAFDELIASELAVMQRHDDVRDLQSASTGKAHRPLPSGVDYTVAFEDGDTTGSYDDPDGDDAHSHRRRPFLSRSIVMLGGSVAALALVGVIGFALWTPGEGSNLVASGEPLLIKADTTPFKTVPKDPGGRSIPNQNKAVYDRVAAPAAQLAPQQQALLTQSEEPLELPPTDDGTPGVYDDSLPGVDLVDNEGLGLKSEARMDASDAAPVPVLQPRKVRTMVVRPDGTLVPSEMQAVETAAASTAPIVAGSSAPAAPSALIEVASVEPRPDTSAAPQPVAEADLAPSVAPEPVVAAPEPVASTAPEPATDVAPPPATLPVEPAADTASAIPPAADPMEVAAIAPPAPVAPMPTGGYFVQISSQPSEALAQKSLQSLGARYSGVIEGRAVGIQSAEIPGKGTFYRVRIAAASKTEAASLCNRLKAAGGNCFVAR
ncbi:SPOR domain-containing protein [Aureimonas sp. Leaf454]|uniref:SPOR domain-containing protein n=1 Tax=Aureimonas sp. Leaf454 TaxID=1736381 RepID=UPI00138F10F6|nr:SPOR domain-containing protein [Aureimonas sp. Leaf454]